jgi:hypothetical protein
MNRGINRVKPDKKFNIKNNWETSFVPGAPFRHFRLRNPIEQIRNSPEQKRNPFPDSCIYIYLVQKSCATRRMGVNDLTKSIHLKLIFMRINHSLLQLLQKKTNQFYQSFPDFDNAPP